MNVGIDFSSFLVRSRGCTFTSIAENGEAKYWLEPQIELTRNYKLSRSQLREIEQIIEEHYDELKTAWQDYFSR